MVCGLHGTILRHAIGDKNMAALTLSMKRGICALSWAMLEASCLGMSCLGGHDSTISIGSTALARKKVPPSGQGSGVGFGLQCCASRAPALSHQGRRAAVSDLGVAAPARLEDSAAGRDSGAL